MSIVNTGTITELRTELFSALRGLSDKSKPMDIERAKAIADVAQTIINSAKVEVDFVRIAGGKDSGFIPSAPIAPGAPALPAIDEGGSTLIEQRQGVRVTQHKLRG
jgi:hypothetical protein